MNTRLWGTMTVGGLIARIALIFITTLWTLPTFGLFVSSFRDREQLITTGWWTSFGTQNSFSDFRTGTAADQEQVDGYYVIRGDAFVALGDTPATLRSYGSTANEPSAFQPDQLIDLGNGESFIINSDGQFEYRSETPFTIERGRRFYYTADIAPIFSLENYQRVLTEEGMGQSFINTFAVTIPATI
ncbi:MAG: carbohydrate ABC transporter permease, partial [Phototrophicaceae bacterium]